MAVASAFVTYINTKEKRESIKMVNRTHEVILSATQFLSHLKDIQSGQRGYIITEDTTFLQVYYNGAKQLSSEVIKLKNLVADNHSQAEFLAHQIIPTAERSVDFSTHNIHILKSYGQDSAMERIGSKMGKVKLDSVRQLIKQFIDNEYILLVERDALVEDHSATQDLVQFASFGLISLTLLLAFARLVRERKRNDSLLDDLQDANETLEKKIIERTDQLTKANQAKDHFLGIASHDLKAPISGVLGLIDIMKRENKNRPEADLEYLSHMEKSCIKMKSLIADLLDVNKIESGAEVMTLSELNLSDILQGLEEEFMHMARKKDINLIIDKVNGVIKSDGSTLSRILENLLSNAIKFSASEKSVMLKTTITDTHVKFQVIDQGPGIPEAELPNLFGKFQRLTNRPTGGEVSTGLGLSIVKELTELLRGEIKVESRIHEGTTFTIIIPI